MPKYTMPLPVDIEVPLLATIPLINQVLRNSPAVLTPVFKSTFDLSATHMGLIASAVPLGSVISAFLAASWVDRIGARPVILVNTLLIVIGAIGFSVAQVAWQLFAARFLIGFGAGAYLGAAMVWVGYRRSNTQFRLYWAEVSSISRLGALGATAPLAFLILLSGWREALFFLALFAAIVGVCLWGSLSNTEVSEEPKSEKMEEEWSSVLTGFIVTRLWTIMVLLGSITTVVGLWGGSWLVSAYQLTGSRVSGLLSLMAIGFVLGSSGCVVLERYLHGWATTILLLVAAIMFLMMAFGVMTVVTVGPGLFILGFCLAPSTLVIAEIRQMADSVQEPRNHSSPTQSQ